MNGLICSGGSNGSKVNVSATGAMILAYNRHYKYIRISNLSNTYVTIMPNPSEDGECPVEFGKGIVLAPKGTPGWFIEFNNNNMFYSDFWAITETGNADLAILAGY